jgi:hypothetical protein
MRFSFIKQILEPPSPPIKRRSKPAASAPRGRPPRATIYSTLQATVPRGLTPHPLPNLSSTCLVFSHPWHRLRCC